MVHLNVILPPTPRSVWRPRRTILTVNTEEQKEDEKEERNSKVTRAKDG
jgi:hypothetical protein